MKHLSMRSVPDSMRAYIGFLKLYACHAVCLQFQSIFMNTYLVKATGGNESVMWFNIALAAVQPFVMIFSVWLMRRKSALFSQRIGLYLYAMVYLLLCVLGETMVPYIQWVGVMLSAAAGFFYTTYAVQILSYTSDGNRDMCQGMLNTLAGVIALATPMAAGALVSGIGGFAGYRVLFAIGFAATVISIFFSYRLAPVTAFSRSQSTQLGKALHVLLHDRAASAAMLSSAANGFYGGTMTFFVNILIFSMVQSEMLVGSLNTVCGVVSILTSIVYARMVRPSNRVKTVWISVGLSLAAAATLFFNMSVVSIIIFQIVLTILVPFFSTTPLTAYMGVVEHHPALKGLGGEVHALREFWYGSGRVLGILMTLALSNMENGSVIVIMIILAVQIIPAMLMKRMQVPAAEDNASAEA